MFKLKTLKVSIRLTKQLYEIIRDFQKDSPWDCMSDMIRGVILQRMIEEEQKGRWIRRVKTFNARIENGKSNKFENHTADV